MQKLPQLEVRTQNQMNLEELQMVKRAQIYGICPIEAWTALGTNSQLSYSTHGIIRFFGKFPPPISSYLIEKYTKKGDLVLDPMSGSGTTGVECILRNRDVELRDVNPLMIMLASVKTTKLNQNNILTAFNYIKDNYKPKDFSSIKNSYKGLNNPDHWFLSETMDSLYGILSLIEKIENRKLKNYFLVCFSGIVRRVSKATTQQGRLFLDIKTAEKDAFTFFEKKVFDVAHKVTNLPKSKSKIKIIKANLKEPTVDDKSVDLIILHPPYFNSYKFSSINSLELFWLGIDRAEIRKNEIREFFKVGKPENHEKFVEDMAKALSNAYLRLKPSGRICLMMGDTVINGEYIPVIKKTIDSANLPNSTITTVALRVPKYTEASWVTSQRRNSKNIGVKIYDFVLVIKKDA